MKSLIVVNEKGGVGKSTLVINLAHYFATHHKVAVVDLDAQANTSFALQQFACAVTTTSFFQNAKGKAAAKASIPHPEHNLTVFSATREIVNFDAAPLLEIVPALKKNILAMDKAGYDFCLLDSPPALGVRLFSGLAVADFVIAPILLDAFSLAGIGNLLETFKKARQINPHIVFLGLVANKVDGRDPLQMRTLATLKAKFGAMLMPVTLGLRSSITYSTPLGQPIWQNRKTSAREAKKELAELAGLILGKMEGTPAHGK